MKYEIFKSILIYPDGTKDIMGGLLKTNNLEAERSRIKESFKCKTVYFSFTELDRSDVKSDSESMMAMDENSEKI